MVFSFTKEIFPDKKTFTNPSPSLRSTCGLLCRSKLNGAAKIYFVAYSRFWPQNQSYSYFNLSQKHEKTSPQNKFSRLVLTGTILRFRNEMNPSEKPNILESAGAPLPTPY